MGSMETRWRRTVAVTAIAVAALGGCASAGDESSSTGDVAAPSAIEAGGEQAQAPAERKRVRTADVDLAVDDEAQVATTADAVVALVDELGGLVDEDVRANGDDARADLVVRVPPDDLELAIDRLGELATVTASSITTEDVTDQYTDLETRIANLEASTVRVRDLVGQADDVVQVAALENELRTRELELEQAKGQLRALETRVELARVTVAIRTEAVAAADEAPAPTEALANGWSAFVAAATWGLAILLTLLPFLAVAALVGLGWRAYRRRHPRPARSGPVAPGRATWPPGHPPAPPTPAWPSEPSPDAPGTSTAPSRTATATLVEEHAGDDGTDDPDDLPPQPSQPS